MAFRTVLAAGVIFACAAGTSLRQGGPEDIAKHGGASIEKGEVPTAGEAVGKTAGVNVPNPHQYTGAIVGGGIASLLLTLVVFCAASYYVYKKHYELEEKGQETHCGFLSCLCCCCCTPLICCFPIDSNKGERSSQSYGSVEKAPVVQQAQKTTPAPVMQAPPAPVAQGKAKAKGKQQNRVQRAGFNA